MSKSKKNKKRSRTPNLSPISMLRPRLDALWKELDVDAPDVAQITSALTKLTAKLQAPDFLPILIRAFHESPMPLRPTLSTAFVSWFQEHNHIDELTNLFTQAVLPEDDQAIVIAWLEAAGLDVELLLAERPDLFYKAYISDDVEAIQTFLWLVCYTNRRRNRINTLIMSIDSDDLWVGAVSMALLTPSRPLEDLDETQAHFEKEFGVNLVEVEAVEIKQWICQALHQNIDQDIRLDPGFLNERRTFMEMLAQLPDTPDDATALTFTEADFDTLSQLNRSASAMVKAETKMRDDLRKKYPDLSLEELEGKWDEEYGDGYRL